MLVKNPFRSKFKVTQEFGKNPTYYKKFGLRGHEGLDIIPTGKSWDILCLEDGIVVRDEDNPRSGAYGIYVTVWHANIKKATQYCHLQENFVKVGDRIKKGQKIGIMGGTGNVTGKHLHLNLFEVDESGYRLNRNNGYLGGIDPLAWLQENNTDDALQECLRQHEKLVKEAGELRNQITELSEEVGQLKKEREKLENEKQEHLNQLAEKLGDSTLPEFPSIMGKIEGLLGYEDANRGYEQEIQKLKEEAEKTKEILQEKENSIIMERKDKDDLTEKLNELKEKESIQKQRILELEAQVRELESRVSGRVVAEPFLQRLSRRFYNWLWFKLAIKK